MKILRNSCFSSYLKTLKQLKKKPAQLFDYIKVLHEYKTAQATKQMKQTSVQQL